MKRIIQNLKRKGQNTLIKILSLSIGLAVAMVLIAKVYFEQNYDHFFPNSERIYQVQTKFKRGNESPREYRQVSGGIAPGMRAEVPGVEAATRHTGIGGKALITDDKKEYAASFILADSCYFDVLEQEVLVGNAKEILSRPMYAMIPRSINEKMGGNAVGKTIEIDAYLDRKITIGGVYEDIPENSHLHSKDGGVIISLNSISNFTGDGRDNWNGNDRYMAYVRLQPNIDPSSLAASIREMQGRHQDLEGHKAAGIELNYTLTNLTKIHNDSADAKLNRLILGIMALVLLSVSMMNYVLITTSNLMARVKEIATHKAFGAEKKDIVRMIFEETIVSLVISLILAAIYILLFQNQIESLMSTSVSALFSADSIILFIGIAVVLCLLTSAIPAYLFGRIPVANAIKNMGDSNRFWRSALLSFQFIAITFFVVFLSIVNMQYKEMTNKDLGYDYDKLLYLNMSSARGDEFFKAFPELKQLSFVENISSIGHLPYQYASGNNVSLLDDEVEIFNMADLTYAKEEIIPTLGLRLISGADFNETSAVNDALISADFDKRVSQYAKWDEGCLGKTIKVTEWGEMRIVGIYEDIQLSSFMSSDKRPSMIHFRGHPAIYLLLKLREVNQENIAQIQAIVDRSVVGRRTYVKIYSDEIVTQYDKITKFENSLWLGGIISLILALVGLIGYVQKELNSRRREIAIRKVNGATIGEIIQLFLKSIIIISIPTIIIGIFAAIYTSSEWMSAFSFKANIPIIIYILGGLLVLTIIIGVVIINSLRVSSINPSEALKSE